MKEEITKKIFKELGHKFEPLNDLYVCILKEDLKEIKENHSHTESHGKTEKKEYDRVATCQPSSPMYADVTER